MDFGTALAFIKEGARISREGWNGKGMWLAMSPGHEALRSDRIWSGEIKAHADSNGGHATFRPYIMMLTAQGDFVPWVASQTDILAEDWSKV